MQIRQQKKMLVLAKAEMQDSLSSVVLPSMSGEWKVRADVELNNELLSFG